MGQKPKDGRLEEVTEDSIKLYDNPLIFYKRWLGLLARAEYLDDDADITRAKKNIAEFQRIMPEIDKLLEDDHSIRNR